MWLRDGPRFEWPTLLMLCLCYGLWGLATWAWDAWWLWMPVAALCITLHSSLQHEATHGHPTRIDALNAALVFPALGLFMPYGRFRALHRAHHATADLTDPVRDTESFFLTAEAWRRAPVPVRWLLTAQNTLIGRLILGPALSLGRFYAGEIRALQAGQPGVLGAWLVHAASLAAVLFWVVWICGVSPLAYLLAAYAGYGILMLRTFAEHRAHPQQAGRSVVIEDRGPLAWLFLFNNLHAVHHRHPGAPWYALPGLFAATKDAILARNGGYRFDSYGALARRYAFRSRQPVVHPDCEAGRG